MNTLLKNLEALNDEIKQTNKKFDKKDGQDSILQICWKILDTNHFKEQQLINHIKMLS